MSRYRIHLPTVALAVALAGPATAMASDLPAPVPFGPATPADLGIELATDPDAATASDHRFRAECDETRRRSASVGLEWTSGSAPAAERRVDISKFWDGFATGQFEVSASLSPNLSGLTVVGPEPGVVYYWRVLTRIGAGWIASETSRFEVPICPWDPPNLEALGLAGTDADGGER